MKPIVCIPNPVLKLFAQPVIRFDKKLGLTVAEMKKALLATTNPRGVGLAAPQIGVSLRIFLARQSAKSPIRVFINPQIISLSEKSKNLEAKDNVKLEGCLSIPKIWGKVNRASIIEIEYRDINGSQVKEKIVGFLATIVQHEIDHLDGVLFTQRVLEQKGKLFQSVRDGDNKEKLVEIEI